MVLDDAGQPPESLNTATYLLNAVEAALHAGKSEWIFLRELRIGTGHRSHSLQRLDAFALNCLPHLGMKRICYEVKTSRADFLCEVRRPLKRRIGMRFSNEFFFVTPAGLLLIEELPIDCGLIEVGTAATEDARRAIRSHSGFFCVDPETSRFCMITVPAPWRDTPGPTWQFAAAMLRNQQRMMAEYSPSKTKQQKFEFQ